MSLTRAIVESLAKNTLIIDALAKKELRAEIRPMADEAIGVNLIRITADPAAMPPTIFPTDLRGFILICLPPQMTDALAASGLRATVTAISAASLSLRVEHVGAPPLDPVAMPPAIFPTDEPNPDLVRRLFAAFLRM